MPLITPEMVTGYLYLHLARYLDGPEFDWANRMNSDGEPDPEGVIITKVPWIVTVADTGPVTVRAFAANLATPGGVSASITATPDQFVIDGGDPEVEPVACTFEQVADEACEYEFYHSSISISDEPGFAFTTRGLIVWDVTTSANGAGTGDFRPVTSSESTIQVGEIQAVVTCVGDC